MMESETDDDDDAIWLEASRFPWRDDDDDDAFPAVSCFTQKFPKTLQHVKEEKRI